MYEKNSDKILEMLAKEIMSCPFFKYTVSTVCSRQYESYNYDVMIIARNDINFLCNQMLNQTDKGHFEMFLIKNWRNLIKIDQDRTKTNTLVDEIKTGIRQILDLDEDTSRILMFGRNNERPESLFEIMLTVKDISKSGEAKTNLIHQTWEKFALFTTPEILGIVSIPSLNILSSAILIWNNFSFKILTIKQKNHLGLFIFDYVAMSEDPLNLLNFLRCFGYYKLFNS